MAIDEICIDVDGSSAEYSARGECAPRNDAPSNEDRESEAEVVAWGASGSVAAGCAASESVLVVCGEWASSTLEGASTGSDAAANAALTGAAGVTLSLSTGRGAAANGSHTVAAGVTLPLLTGQGAAVNTLHTGAAGVTLSLSTG